MECKYLQSGVPSLPELPGLLPGLPRDTDGPVFKAPWEAHAFSMTLALHEKGVFTWPEWAAALTRAIRDAQAAGDPDTGENYYRHWLVALERISTQKGLVNESILTSRKHEWEEAARNTPHGKPIELARAPLPDGQEQ